MDQFDVSLGPITKENVNHLRNLNEVSFPIQYHEKFYHNVISESNPELNKYAYYNGIVVGAICSRTEVVSDVARTTTDVATSTGQGTTRLYIMTLAVLAPYRGRTIGSQLLQSIIDYCESNRDIAQIALHVQISNHDAIRFYCNRFGFVQGDKVENYYRRIDPPHCYLLYKDMQSHSIAPSSEA